MFGLVLSFQGQTRMLKKKKKNSSQNPDIIIHEIEFLPSLAMIGARGIQVVRYMAKTEVNKTYK